ncbi:MAG: hypothetical protein QXF61_07325 [Nitrososphaeria archaeon]
MKVKFLMFTTLTILLLLNASNIYVSKVNAQTNIRFLDLNLQGGEEPVGIVYNNKTNLLYVGIPIDGKLAVVNVSDMTYKLYDADPSIYKLVLDADSNVWASMYSANYLLKFFTVNNTFKTVVFPFSFVSTAITFYEDFIWFVSINVSVPRGFEGFFLVQLNYSSCEIIRFWEIPKVIINGYLFDRCCDVYGNDGKLWITLFEGYSGLDNGVVIVFDVANETFKVIEGFYHPIGLHGDSKYIYVAEAGRVYNTCMISKIDKETFTVTKIDTEAPIGSTGLIGTQYVYVDKYNNVWWTSGSYYIGYIGLSGVGEKHYYRSVELNTFMAEVGDTIWFSAKGSVRVGIVDITSTYSFKDLDINDDGIIDYWDIGSTCRLFGKKQDDIGYNEKCDINKDGIIDYADISMQCRYFGKIW